jgi:hypothetical protein
MALSAQFDNSVIALVAEFDSSPISLYGRMDAPTRLITDLGEQIITDTATGATGVRPDVLDTT